jgi:predicted transglutaminase-like cysteine proteinase
MGNKIRVSEHTTRIGIFLCCFIFALLVSVIGTATEMPVGDVTTQPLGAMLFCTTHTVECNGSLKTTRIALTGGRLGQLQLAQQLNEKLRPASPSVAWHYPEGTTGSCVQYAMSKRRMLLAFGWPASSLQLATATTRRGTGHLVLLVQIMGNTLVLDNLRNDIPSWDDLPYHWHAVQQGASMDHWLAILP